MSLCPAAALKHSLDVSSTDNDLLSSHMGSIECCINLGPEGWHVKVLASWDVCVNKENETIQIITMCKLASVRATNRQILSALEREPGKPVFPDFVLGQVNWLLAIPLYLLCR